MICSNPELKSIARSTVYKYMTKNMGYKFKKP